MLSCTAKLPGTAFHLCTWRGGVVVVRRGGGGAGVTYVALHACRGRAFTAHTPTHLLKSSGAVMYSLDSMWCSRWSSDVGRSSQEPPPPAPAPALAAPDDASPSAAADGLGARPCGGLLMPTPGPLAPLIPTLYHRGACGLAPKPLGRERGANARSPSAQSEESPTDRRATAVGRTHALGPRAAPRPAEAAQYANIVV